MIDTPLSPKPFRSPMLALAAVLALGLAGCAGHAPHIGAKHKPVTPTSGNRVSILTHVEAGAHVDDSISSVAVVVPPAEENEAWAQSGGAANKSNGNLAIGAAPKRVWSVSVPGSNDRRRLASAPVIGGGVMYVMDALGVLHAYDAGSGAPRWTHSFAVEGEIENAVFGGGASYNDGKVYVTTGLGLVAALDAATGKTIWQQKPAGPLRGAPTVAFGSVFVMTQNNEIHALNADDGKAIWDESASLGEEGVFGVAAPAAGQGTVIAGYSTGELIAYRYENGRQLWSDALSRTSLSTSVGVLTDIDADPIIDHGRVYALGQGGRMAAYELVTGERIWELNVAGISTPTVAGDWLFTLTDDSKLLCIARSSGKVRWISQLNHWQNQAKKSGNQLFWTGPLLAGDRLWVANNQGDIYTISTLDGAAKRFGSVGSSVTLAPVVAKGMLYIMADNGTITAFK